MKILKKVVNKCLFPGPAVVIISVPVAAVLLFIYISCGRRRKSGVIYCLCCFGIFADHSLCECCAADPQSAPVVFSRSRLSADFSEIRL